jgi:2'-5' RNA ligase
MKQKYNLALRPVNKASEVIAYAKQLTPVAWEYQLGDFSLPHVTLYHFYLEPEILDTLWKKVLKIWQAKAITLKFAEIATTTYDDKTLHWASLMPDQRPELFKLHEVIANIIEHPLKPTFDPHMTLVNSKSTDLLAQVNNLLGNYSPLQDEFVLTLGSSDQIGQYLEELYTLR